jgi:hypothetical protein
MVLTERMAAPATYGGPDTPTTEAEVSKKRSPGEAGLPSERWEGQRVPTPPRASILHGFH